MTMLPATPLPLQTPSMDARHFLHSAPVQRSTTKPLHFHIEQRVQPAPQPTRRRLRFAKFDQVLEIPHIDDLSDEEVQDVWLSPDEFKTIRQRARDTISFVESAGEDCPQGLCIRGLDQNMPAYSKKRQALQDLLYEAVLRIQAFKATHTDDVVDGLIAELCQKYTAASVAAAVQVGQSDSLEANSQ